MQSGKARDAQLKRKKFEIELIKSERLNKSGIQRIGNYPQKCKQKNKIK